jgi:hypothetical protein
MCALPFCPGPWVATQTNNRVGLMCGNDVMTYLSGEESITSGESFSHGLAASIPSSLHPDVRRATDIAP